jgi:hypothetical protein
MSVVDFGVNGQFPSVIGGTGTTVKYFPRLLGSSIGVQSVAPSATSNAGQLAVEGTNRLNGQLFYVYATGSVVSGSGAASEGVEIALYAQTAAPGASPSYTKIATTANVALNPTVDGVANSFSLSAQLYGDSASGILGGFYLAQYSGVVKNSSPKALEANLSSINFATEPPFGLVVGVTFNVSNAGNSASLYQFRIASE